DRSVQPGRAEQNVLALAAGLATMAFRRYATPFSCFAVAGALDSMRVLSAQPRLDVKIIGGYAGLLTGMTGKTHQMFNDIAITRSLPYMLVVAPAHETEARPAIAAGPRGPGPPYFQITPEPAPRLFGSGYTLPRRR